VIRAGTIYTFEPFQLDLGQHLARRQRVSGVCQLFAVERSSARHKQADIVDKLPSRSMPRSWRCGKYNRSVQWFLGLSGFAFILFAQNAQAQSAEIVAGISTADTTLFADGLPAAQSRISFPRTVIIGPDGLVYIGASDGIHRIGADGKMSTVVKDSQISTIAQFGIDSAGSIYYMSWIGIRKATPGGTPVNIAGYGSSGLGLQEGAQALGSQVQLTGLAVSASGDVYFSDFLTRSVWWLDGNGAVHRVVGPVAQNDTPSLLGFDAMGRLNILYNQRLDRVETDGSETSMALPVHAAAFTYDGTGALYITDYADNRVYRMNADSSLTTVAGSGQYGFSNGCGSGSSPGHGSARDARFEQISSMAFDATGNLLIVDAFNSLVRKVTPSGDVSTIAGVAPGFSGDGGPALAARFAGPRAIAFDSAGNLFIADTGNNRIRKVTTDGSVQTVAGEGSPTVDLEYGCSTQHDTYLSAPQSIAVDAACNLYIADSGKHRVVKIASGGTFSVFAGTGTAGRPPAAIGAMSNSLALDTPAAVGVDRAGNVYIGDGQVRTLKVAPDGTVADVIPGVRAQGFGTQANGDLYVISNWIGYRLTPDDKLIPVAGTGQSSTINPSGTPPLDEPIVNNFPHRSGLTADANGTLYVMNYDGTLARVYASGRVVQMYGDNSVPGGNYFVPQVGSTDLAVSLAGAVHMSDNFHNVVWRIPVIPDAANAQATPQLATGAVRNAGSHQIGTYETILPTGGFISSPYRFIENDVIAPGELIQITGEALGPQDGSDVTPSVDKAPPTAMAGAQVTVAGTPLQLLSVEAGRIVAVTPSTVTPNANLPLVVTFGGGQASTTIKTAAVAPGWFFTPDTDGGATLAATNLNGVPITQSNPIASGAVAALYGTGFGDGLDAQVLVNGVAAQVIYNGRVAGYPGLSQINIIVPATTTGVVDLTVGGVHRAQNARLWVK